jgi:predicted nucleic acid-binding protein
VAGEPRLRCRDADDQVFIDLALVHRARWLLTRDKALLALARRARPLGTEILRPWR